MFHHLPPGTTEEQKRQIKEAQRNNNYIGLTWTLFQHFLCEHQSEPRKALELAEGAMEVWKEFEDGQYMEYPEIPDNPITVSGVVESDSFREAMMKAGEMMARKMRDAREGRVERSMIEVAGDDDDAEFHNPPLPEDLRENLPPTEEGLAGPQSDLEDHR